MRYDQIPEKLLFLTTPKSLIMKYLTFLLAILFCASVFAQNQPPQITNLQTTQVGDQITIVYDLVDNEGDLVEVTFRAGELGSVTLDLNTSNATGDLGTGISSGGAKTIVWDWSAHSALGSNFRIMLVADDLQPVNVQDIVDQVDSLEVINFMSQIVGTRHRTANPAHLADVQQLLVSSFEDHQLETRVHTFDFGPYEAQNIIGRMIGTDEEETFYILDGHYDCVSNSPGADDNGSAVAGVLEALRVLSNYSFRKSIKFIGFDLEESGLVGSLNYVQNELNATETLDGVLNFEMIGYYSNEPNSQSLPAGFNIIFPAAVQQITDNQFRGDFITVVADGPSTFLSAAYKSAIDSYVPELNSVILDIPVPPSNVPDLLRSDHASFWFDDKPAIMLTDGANFRNPNYHTPGDSMGTLNFTFMSQVIKAAVGTLADLAEVRHATTAWTDTDFPSSIEETSICDFEINPNPASDYISIEFGTCGFVDVHVSIVDVKGNTLFENSIKSNVNQQSIDVSQWQRGVYFVLVQNGKHKIMRKIIVSKGS